MESASDWGGGGGWCLEVVMLAALLNLLAIGDEEFQ
jgi:hypothetical protein